MSYTAVQAVLERSRATRLRLLVLTVLAEHVHEEAVQVGKPWETYPSQALIAAKLSTTVRAVRRALVELAEDGEIRRTGRRRGKGAYVYELLLPEDRKPDLAAYLERTKSSGRTRASGRTKAAPERTKSSSQRGRNRPTNQKEPEQEPGLRRSGGDASSDSGIEENGSVPAPQETDDAWERFLARPAGRNGQGGDYEPDDLAHVLRAGGGA